MFYNASKVSYHFFSLSFPLCYSFLCSVTRMSLLSMERAERPLRVVVSVVLCYFSITALSLLEYTDGLLSSSRIFWRRSVSVSVYHSAYVARKESVPVHSKISWDSWWELPKSSLSLGSDLISRCSYQYFFHSPADSLQDTGSWKTPWQHVRWKNLFVFLELWVFCSRWFEHLSHFLSLSLFLTCCSLWHSYSPSYFSCVLPFPVQCDGRYCCALLMSDPLGMKAHCSD